MRLLNQASPAARAALIYITIGALIVIWSCVGFVYLENHPPVSNLIYYWGTGIFLTGLTLIGIGLGLGRIGRSARPADLPPAQPVAVVEPPAELAPTAQVVAAGEPTPPVVAAAVRSVPAPSQREREVVA